MATPGGFKDGRLYSLDNLPPLTYNKIWVGDAQGFPIETPIPGSGVTIDVTANGTGGGQASTINFLDTDDITFLASSPVDGIVTITANLGEMIMATNVAHNGTVVGSEAFVNFIDGANITLTITNNVGTSSIDVEIAGTGGGGGAPTDAQYVLLQTYPGGILPDSFSLGTLTSGILRNTVTGPIAALSIDTNITAISNLTPSNGTLIYGNGSTWTSLGIGGGGQVLTAGTSVINQPTWTSGGTSGQVLTSQGSSAVPIWQSLGSATINVTANSGGGGVASTIDFKNGSGITFTAAAPIAGVVEVSATVSGGGGGTVTSVAVTSPTSGLVITGSAITTAGTITIDLPFSQIIGDSTGNLLLVDTTTRSISANSNTGFGINTLNLLTTGDYNTAFGASALDSITTVTSNNTAVGAFAGGTLAAGVGGCTFLGTYADTTLSSAVGAGALGANTKVGASYSFNIGRNTNTSGAWNVGINQPTPQYALHVSPGADLGTGLANGIAALGLDISTTLVPSPGSTLTTGALYVTSGSGSADRLWFQPGTMSSSPIELTADDVPASSTSNQILLSVASSAPVWGSYFLDDPITNSNFFLGSTAGNTTTTRSANIGVGIEVFPVLTNIGITNSSNTGFGYIVLQALTTGTNNAAFGQSVFSTITTDDLNTGFGTGIFYGLTGTGNVNNTAIGANIGVGVTHADNSTCVGYNTSGASIGTNYGAFGANAIVNRSNAIRLGANCNVGINQNSPGQALHVSAGASAIEPNPILPTPAAAIQIDNTLVANNPLAFGGAGIIYVNSSTDPTTTNADRLWFQPGVGSPIELSTGHLPLTGSNGQILSVQAGSPAWYSYIYDGTGIDGTFTLGTSNNPVVNQNNVSIGRTILPSLRTGTGNMGLGLQVFTSLTSGINNTGFGYVIGNAITTGQYNTCVGNTTGTGIITGDFNSFFGANAGATGDQTNSAAFGANTLVSASDSINIGNNANVGINQSTPNSSLHIGNDNSGIQRATLEFDLTPSPIATQAINGAILYATGTPDPSVTNTQTVLWQKDTSVGTTSGQILLTPTSGLLTFQWLSNFWTPQNATALFTKIGNIVTMAFNSQDAGPTISIPGVIFSNFALPTFILPLYGPIYASISTIDNGLIGIGQAAFYLTGTYANSVVIGRTQTTTGGDPWAPQTFSGNGASGTSGFAGFQLTYTSSY